MLFLCLVGCENNSLDAEADLEQAAQAIQRNDWTMAERYYERYLRQEQDAERRWIAWQGLLQVVGRASRMDSRLALNYIDTMLMEYADDDGKLKILLPHAGKLAESVRKYDQAIDFWDRFTSIGDLTEEEALQGHTHLAQIHFKLGQYAIAEDVLQDGFALAGTDKSRAQYLYALADIYAMREQWQEVVDFTTQILELPIDENTKALSAFLMADALEQQKKYKAALEYFTLSRKGYPNVLVVDNRIKYLKDKLKK